MKKNLIFLSAIALLTTGCFKTREEIARERNDVEVRNSLQQNIADYNQTIERMQSEIGRLQGRVEEMEHQRRKEMSGFTSSLSSKTESGQKAVDEMRTRLLGMQEAQNALFEEIKKLKEDNLQMAKNLSDRPQTQLPAASAGAKKKGGSTSATGGGAGASFESALAAYKAKDYDSAAEGFRNFLRASPRSKRVLDARFFLGDSLYKKNEFAEAVVEFGVVHEKVPASALGRKSTLRIAQSFKAMGKEKDAKAFAQILLQTAPQSDEAKKARAYLK